MGVPKQKWTPDEETALKAGIAKHGAGKWRRIIHDPDFSGILHLRSNIDLKDKWRNMSVTANGCGSRKKNRLVQNENPMALSTRVNLDDMAIDACPIAVSYISPPNIRPERSITRLNGLIVEATSSLKEPGGSNMTDIAAFIELKEKNSIAPSSSLSDRKAMSDLEAELRATSETYGYQIRIPTQAEIDLELAKMRHMTPEEAAAAAARAVADAEAAIAAAEEAVKEAEAAEAEAAEAAAYAEACAKELAKKNGQKKTSSLKARAWRS